MLRWASVTRRQYTTSGIDSLYGIASVANALHTQKRRALELKVQKGLQHSNQSNKKTSVAAILDQCTKRKVPIHYTDKGELNNLTDNRPHQGIVMKATPIATMGLRCLMPLADNTYQLDPSDSKCDPVELRSPSNRLPLWIALDQVQDPQNLGSIIRTAHFFGVDGLVLCSKNSAPLSPVVSKVSAGAMEMMDIYTTRNLGTFLQISHENGWQILGAAADGASLDSLSHDQPRILVFGNEGTGLRTNVRRHCDTLISIEGSMEQQQRLGVVESLNVGVAMGILVSRLIQ
ncbi:hypothetical protein DM01DRAFT_266444 [Hesseltinella vesiculosa]|uniref:rRNA methyltransferase 1, mitochondrial n=1 Tax=Hesseltinella vesiculosa TaxID=101127 RepID=A0A1X2G8J3_9FUNG|nr:hypothetical protein DM01DRAFT_266444 [Hesseltinella vesiculosa]